MRTRWSLGALGLFTAALLAVSWQRWGNPVSDPGLDLTVSAGWLHGIEPYRDVRYFYGPLGIGGLSATFALLGTSLAAAWTFGLLLTTAIAATFHRLARRWLDAAPAIAATAVVLAIGFSGSLFNLQLAHTESASTGVLALLVLLLGLASGWRWLPGAALGALALTRPEFLAFGFAALGGAALGEWRAAGLRPATAIVLRAIPGAALVALPVLGWFASRAGLSRLLTENLFPVDFVRTVGGRFEHHWHPYDLTSVGTLLLRGVVLAAAVLLVVAIAERRRPVADLRRWAIGGVALIACALLCGLIDGHPGEPLRLVVDDVSRLVLPMTALPAIAFVALGVAALRWWRRDEPLLGESWLADGALLATAAACTLRAYGDFSTDIYATYYAAPAVLVAAILLARIRRPQGVTPIAQLAVLWLAALALAAHAWLGRYRDFGSTVRAPHGTYRALTAAGPNVQGVVDLLEGRVRPGEPMVVLPQEPGFHFLLGTRPALYNATFLPGTLATSAQDGAAARQLISGVGGRPPARFVIVAARRFEAWGFHESGDDFNRQLMGAVRAHYRVLATFGDVAHPPASDEPAVAYTVYERR